MTDAGNNRTNAETNRTDGETNRADDVRNTAAERARILAGILRLYNPNGPKSLLQMIRG